MLFIVMDLRPFARRESSPCLCLCSHSPVPKSLSLPPFPPGLLSPSAVLIYTVVLFSPLNLFANIRFVLLGTSLCVHSCFKRFYLKGWFLADLTHKIDFRDIIWRVQMPLSAIWNFHLNSIFIRLLCLGSVILLVYVLFCAIKVKLLNINIGAW